jgi:hypothetical protein
VWLSERADCKNVARTNQRLASLSKTVLPAKVDRMRIGTARTPAMVATCSDVPSDDRSRPHGCAVADGDAANDDGTTADPDLAAGDDWAARWLESRIGNRGERSSFESRMLAYSLIIVPRPRFAANEEWA